MGWSAELVAVVGMLMSLWMPGGEEGLPCTGREDPALAVLDDLMRGFVVEHEIPGAALAVAREGRLVYARGFGYADVEERELVRPTSLFRIASVSKPITSAAVLKLVEGGQIELEDRVYELLELDGKAPGGSRPEERWREVTVRQLLQHTGGWDREGTYDPMFRSVLFAREAGEAPPAEPWAIIRGMLGRRLDFEPGERYAYSNFGYCLLGRVVEKVTGKPYGEAVRSLVLEPVGIRRMRLGRTKREDRAAGEVTYYAGEEERTGRSVFAKDLGEEVPQPYGAWSLEAMDAHGGWLASAVDLARFGSALDELILSPSSVAEVSDRPAGRAGHREDGVPREVYYGLGWSVRRVGEGGGVNRWHTGSLPGTSSLLVRRHDGLCWGVLFNTRGRTAPGGKIDPLVHWAVDEVAAWPEIDLFPVLLTDGPSGRLE